MLEGGNDEGVSPSDQLALRNNKDQKRVDDEDNNQPQSSSPNDIAVVD